MADGSPMGMKRPRIAFTGEEYGFGYQAVAAFKDTCRQNDGFVADAGFNRVHRRPHAPINIEHELRHPLRTKEQALTALTTDGADIALVPLYHPYSGYDTETLNTISALFSPMGVELVEATDRFALAVYEPQVLDVVQASHPGSGLSDLMRKPRRSWNAARDRGEDLIGLDETGPQFRAGLEIDSAAQMLLRDRVDTIFAGPEAMRRCKAKLDGFRGAGVKVEETIQWIEPHREMSRRVRESLDGARQTNTFFDPRSGQTHFVSTMSAETQTRPLYAVVLPFEVADRSPDFTIIDPDLEDADPPKTRFMVVQENPDVTLIDDIYKLNFLRTNHWIRRLNVARNDAKERFGGRKGPGVRMLVRFQRAGSVTSIGAIEDYLRYFGVRHSTVRMKEDSEREQPAAVVLDIEFDLKHFGFHPLHGSVVRGFLVRAFTRWKHGSARFLAVMPFGKPQLPSHRQRRWWAEGIQSVFASIGEATQAFATLFIQRLGWLLPILALLVILYYFRYWIGPEFAAFVESATAALRR